MHSIKSLYVADNLGGTLTSSTIQISIFFVAFCIFVMGERRDFKIVHRLIEASPSL